MRVTITCLCLLAVGLNIWLSWQKLTDQIDTLAGCGKGSGCESALGSRWSMVFGVIPVSIPAALTYLALLVGVWMNSDWSRLLRLTIAWSLLGAVIWFTGLQLFVLDGFCKYCVTSHTVSTFIWVLVMWLDGRPFRTEFKTVTLTALLAVVGMSALVSIQIFGPGPKTSRVDTFVKPATSAQKHADIHTKGEGRSATFLGGLKSYRVESLPHIGDASAPHVFVKYFDYTCDSCRDVDGDLKKALKRHPGKFVVILLPAPLNRSCNPHLPADVKDHLHACELASYALAVWKADPKTFPTYHKWLFQKPHPSPAVAKAKAESLIGAETLAKTLSQNWHEQIIQQNVADYRLLIRQTAVMPKILLGGNQLMQGVARDYDTFLALLENEMESSKP